MSLLSSAKYTEKKSKFFAELYKLESSEEIIQEFSKKHKKAAHVCYALIHYDEEIFKNDGEVGYPGKTLLELLKHNNLDSHLLIVARYFGGIKLGPGGVSRAFKEAGKECIRNISDNS